MKYAVEMGSGALIYIPSFIEAGSGIQKLIGTELQTHRQTDRQHCDLVSVRLFTQNKDSRLISRNCHLGNREGDRIP
jgi:hypothetical protein